MKAVTWRGRRDVGVSELAEPRIEEPTDAILRVTSTGICGSDLHLYDVLAPFMTPGDVLGHEAIGVVEDVGTEVHDLAAGDRVVVPFQIACGECFMCSQGLQTQCETTQVRQQGMGAALYGYTKLYGQVPGGQAEYLRVRRADYNPIKVPDGPPDDRFVYLSDVLPTAWQAIEYADLHVGDTVVVLGVGPIGDMACRIAAHRGHRVIAVDLVPERLARVQRFGVDVVDLADVAGDRLVRTGQGRSARSPLAAAIDEMTDGRGPDAVVDAVGMEAHGSPAGQLAHRLVGLMPDALAEPMMRRAGTDRLAALRSAIEIVRRGGTISVVGVYGGMTDPLPMLTMFDKQIQLRMGQANVRRWADDIVPLLTDEDPLGVDDFATHRLPLADAAHAYAIFRDKQDGACKVLLEP